jgi:hypothetical protein
MNTMIRKAERQTVSIIGVQHSLLVSVSQFLLILRDLETLENVNPLFSCIN